MATPTYTFEELAEESHRNSPRRVIVLSTGRTSRPLAGAIQAAKDYDNESGEAMVSTSKGSETGWRWEREFLYAASYPNTFLVVEDGSVFQRSLVELRDQLTMIATLGGGLSFGHQSNELFDELGAGFYVLADEPLQKLLNVLTINEGLEEMHLLTPMNAQVQSEATQTVARNMLREGVAMSEVARRLGVNRSTIHRWKKSWAK